MNIIQYEQKMDNTVDVRSRRWGNAYKNLETTIKNGKNSQAESKEKIQNDSILNIEPGGAQPTIILEKI